MNDQNQHPPADDTNNNQSAQNPPSAGGSLLNRVANRPTNTPNGTPPSGTPQNGTAPTTATTNPPATNPLSRPPFGAGKSGGGTGGSGTSPFRPLPTREQIEFALLPLHGLAVRFELKGLGDPFYRLLGHDVNVENSDSRLVVRKLEQGGDVVKKIQVLLDLAWEKYSFRGASLVYQLENEALMKQLNAPSYMPKKDFFDDDDEQDTKAELPKPAIKVLRSIDMVLVLNVLSRARTQVLLGTSPIMFNQHYLNRALVSDDPRLVTLAMATGVI
ncbi:MAG: hypothetical protein SH821_14735 [Phototrophicales bacterium]|nr:hypothetical protein [Phototrophicales bacterium]